MLKDYLVTLEVSKGNPDAKEGQAGETARVTVAAHNKKGAKAAARQLRRVVVEETGDGPVETLVRYGKVLHVEAK